MTRMNLQSRLDRLVYAAAALDPSAGGTAMQDMNEIERGLRLGELHSARRDLQQFLVDVPRVHVISLDGEGGWVIEHPLACRRDDEVNLSWCPYNKAAVQVGQDTPGRHFCQLDDNGVLQIGDEV